MFNLLLTKGYYNVIKVLLLLWDDEDNNIESYHLTRSNPKGIYTSWSITDNMTFTTFYPIIYAKLINNYM